MYLVRCDMYLVRCDMLPGQLISVERTTLNRKDVGSNPTSGDKYLRTDLQTGTLPYVLIYNALKTQSVEKHSAGLCVVVG